MKDTYTLGFTEFLDFANIFCYFGELYIYIDVFVTFMQEIVISVLLSCKKLCLDSTLNSP